MKRIRILTGRHVGSSLDLAPGAHRVGPSQDCDIALTDWDFAPLELVVDEQGVHARWDGEATADGAAVPGRHRFEDFVARRFGEIVVCVGPSEGTWPSDVQLLDQLFQPTPQRVARWAGTRLLGRRPMLAVGAIGTLVALVAALGVTLMLSDAAPPPTTLAMARETMQRSLDRLQAGRLVVATEASSLVVTGLVETSAQANEARQVIAAARGPHPALQRFAVAAEVAETIRGTVGLANATVKHAGNGVFTFAAEAKDLKAARAAIDRVQADLSTLVSRIDVTLEQTATADNTPILSRMTADGLSVVQTRDGVKHLVMRSADESPITVNEVLSLPSTLARPEPPALPINPSPRSKP